MRWLLLLPLIFYVGYLGAGLGRGDSTLDHLITDWLQIALLAGAAGIAFAGARHTREDRRAWICMALAIASMAVGQLVWVLAYRNLPEPPFPSVSDVFWTLPYLLYYAGVVLLIRRRVRRFLKSWWLDGLIAVLAVSALATALIFEPLRALTGGDPAAVAVALAYPVADIVLIAVLAAVFAMTGWRPGRTWTVLAIGLLLNSAADVAYTWQSSAGTYTEGTPIDALWVITAFTVAAAPWQSRPSATRMRLQGWRAIAAPLGFGTLMLALLASDYLRELGPVAGGLAIAALAAVLLRTGLTFRENLQLNDSRRLAATDDLTGLANRRGFYARADAALAAAHAQHLPTALMLLDLDRFKEFNDTLGHQAGDELLSRFAERLAIAVPDAQTLCRLGGDEFVLLLPAGAGAPEALEAADRLTVVLDEPVVLDGLLAHVSASIGIAVSPEHGCERSDLLRRADVAMYRAKTHGSGVEIYDPTDDPHSRDRLALVSDLRQAFGRGQLLLHHQPKVDLATGEVSGVEALVRWQHPERGLLFPDAFIPLVERYGLARPLTLEVLDLALAARDTWSKAGYDLQIAVNLTAADVLDARLPDDVRKRLETWRVPPGALKLEITENTVMLDPVRTLDVLARLSELGVGLSLDDFGTGYSSLAYLKRLPVKELKIDRSFVMAMTESSDDDVIVRSTALLGRNLGLNVVAEGVETAEHFDRVREYGCHVAQGYYLSRPLPADALLRWLEALEPQSYAGIGSRASAP
jgi:diguanylate cyclase (GGDEF)-like protein